MIHELYSAHPYLTVTILIIVAGQLAVLAGLLVLVISALVEIAKENRMMRRLDKAVKNRGTMAALFLCAMALLSGCMSGGLSPDRPGYEEGRVVEFLYIASKPALPDQIGKAITGGYLLLDSFARNDALNASDTLVKAGIAEIYPDATPAFREMVFNFYAMAKTRLDGVIAAKPTIPIPTIVSNFLAGIEDARKDYTPQPRTDN